MRLVVLLNKSLSMRLVVLVKLCVLNAGNQVINNMNDCFSGYEHFMALQTSQKQVNRVEKSFYHFSILSINRQSM